MSVTMVKNNLSSLIDLENSDRPLLATICSFLPFSILLGDVSLTCKEIHNLIYNNLIWSKILNVENKVFTVIADRVGFALQMIEEENYTLLNQIKHLHLKHIPEIPKNNSDFESRKISEEWSEDSDEMTKILIQPFKNIETIEFTPVYGLSNIELDIKIMKENLPKLKSIYLNLHTSGDWSILLTLLKLKNFQNESLVYIKCMDNDHLHNTILEKMLICENFKYLNNLKTNFAPDEKYLDLEKLENNKMLQFSDLKKLKLYFNGYSSNISEKYFVLLMSLFINPNLETLDLIDFGILHKDFLKNLDNENCKLRKVYLNYFCGYLNEHRDENNNSYNFFQSLFIKTQYSLQKFSINIVSIQNDWLLNDIFNNCLNLQCLIITDNRYAPNYNKNAQLFNQLLNIEQELYYERRIKLVIELPNARINEFLELCGKEMKGKNILMIKELSLKNKDMYDSDNVEVKYLKDFVEFLPNLEYLNVNENIDRDSLFELKNENRKTSLTIHCNNVCHCVN
ncbi:hypothetical protein ABK040_012358 [Willaertia magna]